MTKPILSARADFPILQTRVNDKPLVYLDNAATTQKPQAVIDALVAYYTHYNSNVHRGNHTLSMIATGMLEASRRKVQAYINAESEQEIIFTKGTTDSINLVAFSFGEAFIQPGDEIIVSELEHHSNFVPWYLMCQRKGAIFKMLPVTDDLELDMAAFKKLLSEKTRLVAINHVSNSMGTVNPIEEIIALAHTAGAAVLVDAAQSVQHIVHDVRALDCDFYAFSGHKMYGPTGIGVLYGKREWLEKLPPYQSGGEMISYVSAERVDFNSLPFKFEAGTPNIEGPIGLAAAIDYLGQYDEVERMAYEDDLLSYCEERLGSIPGLKLYGNPRRRVSVLSFNLEGAHHYDVGTMLDTYGLAVRTGQHCAQPIMDRLGINGTIRASLAFYNTQADIDALVEGILRVQKLLRI